MERASGELAVAVIGGDRAAHGLWASVINFLGDSQPLSILLISTSFSSCQRLQLDKSSLNF